LGTGYIMLLLRFVEERMYHNGYSKCTVSKLCEMVCFISVTFTFASTQKLKKSQCVHFATACRYEIHEYFPENTKYLNILYLHNRYKIVCQQHIIRR
jgi:hypothetical protein